MKDRINMDFVYLYPNTMKVYNIFPDDITETKIIDMDFSSLYPEVLSDNLIKASERYKIMIRNQERKEKLEKINNKNEESN